MVNKKEALKIVLCGICIVLVCIWFVIRWGEIFEPISMDMYNEQIETFHSLENNSLDLIVYGSSHAWLGIDTRMMGEYGINAYNYACSWQNFDTTALFLAESLLTQKPKVAVIDTFLINVLTYDDLNRGRGQLDYTRCIHDCEYKRKYLKRCYKGRLGEAIYYYVPFLEYHDNWADISEYSITGESTNEYDFVETRGFRPNDICSQVNLLTYDELPQYGLSDESIEILDEMILMCKENDVTPVLVTVPCADIYMFSDATREYCEEKDITYINYWEHLSEIGIDENVDFMDEAHLNSSGARKVTEYLINCVTDNIK